MTGDPAKDSQRSSYLFPFVKQFGRYIVES